MAGGILERTNFRGEGGSGGGDGWRLFDFGDKGRADDGGVGKATENGDMAGQGNSEANDDRQMCDGAGAPQERGQIVGKRIFGAGDARSRNQIEKTGRAGGDFREAFVGRGGRAEEDGVEMVSSENAAIVDRF